MCVLTPKEIRLYRPNRRNVITPKGVATVQEAWGVERKLTLGYWKLSVT